METPEPTGADLDVLLRSKHPFRQSCKGCGSDDVMRAIERSLAAIRRATDNEGCLTQGGN